MSPGVLAFAHIQKTAGVTINTILRRSFGMAHCEVEPLLQDVEYHANTYGASDHRHLRRLYPGARSIAGHRVKPCSDLRTVCPDIRYYTMLREPIARMASQYQYVVRRLGENVSFAAWVVNENLHNLQTRHIAGVDRADDAIELLERECFFVGLVERFDEAMVLWKARTGEEGLDIRYVRRNVASDSSVSRSLLSDAESLAFLRDLNREDVKLYEHVRDDLFPRYVRDHGSTLADDVARLRNQLPGRRFSLSEQLSRAKRRLLYLPALGVNRRLARDAPTDLAP